MSISTKIIAGIEQLDEYVKERRDNKERLVICQGHFNVIHPGHLRFIEFAKKHGDCLIVAVHGEKKIDKSVKDRFFSVEERSRGIASLEYVDRVIVFEDNFENILKIVKPDYYVMGEEFSKKTNSIKSEIKMVEQSGGKVIFNSGESYYFSADFLEKSPFDLREERKAQFRRALNKQNISVEKLNAYIDNFENKHILVIGDTIVDQYVACDAIGMSSEAPVLVVKEIENKEFVGGAAIVARHVKKLGAMCSFISLIGKDEPAKLVKDELSKDDIITSFIEDEERPTTFKIRYVVEAQKVLRVSRLKESHLDTKGEDRVIEYLNAICKELDGIIVSDFGYGILTPRILEHISHLSNRYNIKLFGDSQSSSQIGDILKFKGYHLITPTEKEARIALDDKYSGLEKIGNNLLEKTKAPNIVVTLGAEGFIAFEKTNNRNFVKTQHFPALNPHPVDVVGAGDSLLTGLAVSLCGGANLMEASALSSIVASVAVSKMGNVPVSIEDVKEFLATI